MSGISHPDRQGICQGCGRVLTWDGERTNRGDAWLRCPGATCEGSAFLPALPGPQHLVGKTVVRVEERSMAGRDTYKDTITWTQTIITFTDGAEITFGGSDVEVYDAFEYDGIDDDNNPIPKET